MQCETIAVRIRKALLQKVSEKEVYEIDKIRLQVIKNTKIARHDFSNLFALKFLKVLNPIQDRFIKKEETYRLSYSWQKFYKQFLDLTIDQCNAIINIPVYLNQFKEQVPTDAEALFEKYTSSPKNLLAFRSIQWFLNEKNFLQLLINSKLLKNYKKKDMVFRWSNNDYLWRKIKKKTGVEYELNHALANLPSTLLLSIIDKIEDKAKANILLVQVYDQTRYKAFQQFIESKKEKKMTQGIFQDVDAIVSKVQKEYFQSMKSKVQVDWLKNYTVRKLAHYNFKNDEICFSLIFDMPNLNQHMLSYLAYHELLHRHLGLTVSKKTIQAHTPEFKKMEQAYPNAAKLEKKLRCYVIGKG